jgi:hypothetical protein
LVDACFIVIAGFVGMRASEILSIRSGAIEYSPLGTTGAQQAYLVARLFKTAEVGGRLERWLAPEPVVTAVRLLERLSEPLRVASGRDELFLTRNTQYCEVIGITNMNMNGRIREFAAYNGVRHYEGTGLALLKPSVPQDFCTLHRPPRSFAIARPGRSSEASPWR